MKKIVSAWIISILFTLPSYAGLYANLNLGGNFVDTSQKVIVPARERDRDRTEANLTAGYANFHGQLALGYEYPIWSGYLALEGDLDFFQGDTKYRVKNWLPKIHAQVSEHFTTGWGLFVLPEIPVNDTILLFIGPGYTKARYSISNNGELTGGAFGLTGNTSTWLSGWGLKTGATIDLTTNMDLLLTYEFMNYQAIERITTEPFSNIPVYTKSQPVVNMVMAGLRYTFW